MASRIERLRNLFLLVFFLLIISIIFTPLLVGGGFSIFSEETLESILLLIQVFVGWRIFYLYESAVRRREKEIQKLEGEYQRREAELLEAFAYLGKVNVQISLIQSFLRKIKAPSSRKEVESYINEILEIALTLSGKKWVTLRALDVETLQTASEYWARASTSSESEMEGIKIGNKDIVRWDHDREESRKNGYIVLGSSGSGISPVKVFLVFLNGNTLEPDIEDFLRAVANQCEVLLTLFDQRGK
ncbi:MAG TPA: hypothetical protein VK254_04505 [Candidatus Bathyarchaeia archaeon]|nr:hypothetical protein [Candidatus Bathyarchaeia archaeon]